MKSRLQNLALIASLFIGISAHASLLIEPYLGYAVGKTTAGGNSQNVTGMEYGGRLGFQQLGFMGGLDYMTGQASDNSTPKYTLVPSDLGVFVGFNFPILLRVYGVYNFMTKVKETRNSVTNTLDGGDGIKLGVGFTFLPLFSINLEYLAQSYKKMDGTTMTNTVNNNMYGISISLPLNI